MENSTEKNREKHRQDIDAKQMAMARYLLNCSDHQRRTMFNAMKKTTAESVRKKYEQLWAENVASWDGTVREIYLNSLKRTNSTKYQRITELLAQIAKKSLPIWIGIDLAKKEEKPC